MRCIPIRTAPTISVLIGWFPTFVPEMYVMVEGRLVGPSNKLPFPKRRRKQSVHSSPTQNSAKLTIFANRSSISPISKGRGRQTRNHGYSSDYGPNEGDSSRINALSPLLSLTQEDP